MKTKNDYAHEKTDDIILKMERKIKRTYDNAYKNLKKGLSEYLKQFEEKDKAKRKQLLNGYITKNQYDMWKMTEIMFSGDYTRTETELAEFLSAYDRMAMQIIKDGLPEIYALNMNYGTYLIEKSINIDTTFSLYDKATVERLIKENPKLLPEPNPEGKIAKEITGRKRQKWNRQHINSVMTQAILQGESIPNIAKRLRSITDMNKRSAITNARTMATSAENGGRENSYKRAEDMGIDLKRVWIATLDNRTRHEHRLLDGQERKVGEPFEVNGYRIKFPGDPNASPRMIYNCRCRTIAKVNGVNFNLSDLSTRKNKLDNVSYEEWKHKHEVKNAKG